MTFFRASLGALVILQIALPALAESKITITTNHYRLADWTVSAVSGGNILTLPAAHNRDYSGLYNITLPPELRSVNDGYWYADNLFTLPANVSKPMLVITYLGVDDRAVIELNGKIVANVGYAGYVGRGYMTFRDKGPNRPFTFTHSTGPVSITINDGFIAGANDLRMIVNNTGEAIGGVPVRPYLNHDPTWVDIAGYVEYSIR